MTTTKQMQRFAISLIKAIETQKQKKIVALDYKDSDIYVWFKINEEFIHTTIYKFLTIRENTKVFKEALQAIKDIR
jgi:hypothetical protein